MSRYSSSSSQPHESPLTGRGDQAVTSDEAGFEPLIIAIVKRNDLAGLKDYLESKQPAWIFAEQDDQGKTALHWAAELNQVAMALALVSLQDLEAKDHTGRTAMFYAIGSEYSIALVEILLIYGAQVNHVDRQGRSPLRLALEGGDDGLAARLAEYDTITWYSLALKYGRSLDDDYHDMNQMARLLIQRGADALTTNENGRTAIHIAAAAGNMAALKLLQPFQHTVDRRDGDGETALSLAAAGGWRHVVKYLFEDWVANINTQNERGWTPLHHAASKGHPQVVTYLLDQGADQFARTESGETALWIACLSREDEIGLKLLKEMTIPRAFSLQSTEGISLACVAAEMNCIKVMTSLIRHARGNTEDGILSDKFEGCSYAFVAIRAGSRDTAIALLEAGATIEGVDKDENNALHFAAMENNDALVGWLLENNDQAEQWSKMKNRDRRTPEEAAASFLNKDAMTAFLTYCDPERAESADTAGWTALHWAAFYGRLDLVSILVMAGADVTEKDSSGKTAIEVLQSPQQATMEMSMSEWLSLPDSQTTTDSPGPISRPSLRENAESVCKSVFISLVDFYSSTTIEKSWVSVHDVLYNFGAQDIMSVAANARGIKIEDELRMRWIHLPVNNTFWLKDLLQSIYVDLAESWNDGGSSKSDTTSNIPHYSTSSIFEVPLDVQHDRSDDAGNTRVRFDNEYIPVPSANSSTSDDTMGDHPGLIQASLEHSKLLSFINACLPLDTGLDQFQHVSPFIKFLTTGSSGKYYDSDITNLESIRVGLSVRRNV
ncbi:ankyrin repeat-containing domain protein [Pestalotiopsis sp. NC0098]|nr:ankyrin repeat-containing domain protein [Pestalotiopsis sp. NC0098]